MRLEDTLNKILIVDFGSQFTQLIANDATWDHTKFEMLHWADILLALCQLQGVYFKVPGHVKRWFLCMIFIFF